MALVLLRIGQLEDLVRPHVRDDLILELPIVQGPIEPEGAERVTAVREDGGQPVDVAVDGGLRIIDPLVERLPIGIRQRRLRDRVRHVLPEDRQRALVLADGQLDVFLGGVLQPMQGCGVVVPGLGEVCGEVVQSGIQRCVSLSEDGVGVAADVVAGSIPALVLQGVDLPDAAPQFILDHAVADALVQRQLLATDGVE